MRGHRSARHIADIVLAHAYPAVGIRIEGCLGGRHELIGGDGLGEAVVVGDLGRGGGDVVFVVVVEYV